MAELLESIYIRFGSKLLMFSMSNRVPAPILDNLNIRALERISFLLQKIKNQQAISNNELYDFFSSALYVTTLPKTQIETVTRAADLLREFISKEHDKTKDNFMHFIAKYPMLVYTPKKLESLVEWALQGKSRSKAQSVYSNINSLKKSIFGSDNPNVVVGQAQNSNARNYILSLLSKPNATKEDPLSIALNAGDMKFVNMSDELGGFIEWDNKNLYGFIEHAIKNNFLSMFNYLLLKTAITRFFDDDKRVKGLIKTALEKEKWIMLCSLLKKDYKQLNVPYLFDLVLDLPLEKCLDAFIELKKNDINPPVEKKIKIFQKLVGVIGQGNLPTRQSISFNKIISTLSHYQPDFNDFNEQQGEVFNSLFLQLQNRFNNKHEYGPGLFSSFGYSREKKIFCITKLIAALSDPAATPKFTQGEIKCLTQKNSKTGKLLTQLFPGITAKNFESRIPVSGKESRRVFV